MKEEFFIKSETGEELGFVEIWKADETSNGKPHLRIVTYFNDTIIMNNLKDIEILAVNILKIIAPRRLVKRK